MRGGSASALRKEVYFQHALYRRSGEIPGLQLYAIVSTLPSKNSSPPALTVHTGLPTLWSVARRIKGWSGARQLAAFLSGYAIGLQERIVEIHYTHPALRLNINNNS